MSILGDLAGLIRRTASPVNEAPVNEAPVNVSGSAWAGAGMTSAMTTANQLDGMSTSAMVFTVVNTIAEGVSAVNWHLYRRRSDGRRRYGPTTDNRVEVVHHPALTVLRRPNQFYTQAELVEASIQHYELTGEWAWIVARSDLLGPDSMPLELWPVRPDRLIPVKDPTRFQVGWIYAAGNERVPLELNQVIHTRRPNPVDPYRGLSPIAAGLVDIYGEEAAAAWNMNFFRNGAEPGGLIRFDETLEDTEFKLFRRRWNEQHRGVSNAHRVALLERGEWVDRKYTRKDMEFLDGRRFSQEAIRRAWRMPKAMLGDTEDVNRANAEAGAVIFGQWLVVPRARKLMACLNSQLLPLFGQALGGVEFDFDDPTPPDRAADREDRTAAVERAERLIGMGVDPAEAFEHEGLPAFTVTRPAAPGSSGVLPTALAASHHGHGPVAAAPPDDPDLPDVRPLQDDFERVMEPLVDDWSDAEDDQKIEIVDAIRRIVEDGTLSDLSGITVDTSATADLLAAAMADVAEAAAAAAAAEAARQRVGLAPVVPPTSDLEDVAGTMADVIAWRLVGGAIAAALRAHSADSPVDDVVTAAREHLAGLSKDTPRPQLTGALTGAQNEARLLTMAGPARRLSRAPGNKAGDLVVGWVYAVEVNDENTCDRCAAIDETIIAQTDEMDEVRKVYPGGGYGGYKNCRGRERCRGTFVAVYPPDPDDEDHYPGGGPGIGRHLNGHRFDRIGAS